MPPKSEVDMAKKPEVADPGTLDGPELARFLANKIEAIELGVKAAIDTVVGLSSDVQTAVQADLANIRPICEEFPNLCRTVEGLKSGIAEITPAPTTKVSQAADNLALHYKECTDPACRRAIEARLAAVGLAQPPEPITESEAADHQEHTHDIDSKDNEPPQDEVKPWEKLKISENKYRKHKSYYDDAIKNGA